MNSTPEPATCKLCGSPDTVKFGSYNGVQRWWCKTCRHKFAANNAISKMRTPAELVAAAVEMYYDGVRLNAIPSLMFRQYNHAVTGVSVFQWVKHLTQQVTMEVEGSRVFSGLAWIAEETPVKTICAPGEVWLLDIIDANTGFVLASRASVNRNPEDIRALLKMAADRAGRSPSVLFSAGSREYLNYLQQSVHTDAHVVRVIPEGDPARASLLVCWRWISNRRLSIIRNIRKEEQVSLILEGWRLHYNYFRHSGSLNSRLPA